MKYYTIEPEVAGGWGKNTIAIRDSGKLTQVQRLHYEFYGWTGDELLTSSPCFIVSYPLAEHLRKSHFTGTAFEDVEITTSEEFRTLHPDLILPKFVWLQITGKPGVNDFGITQALQLVVSGRALEALQHFTLNDAVITPFNH